MAHTTDNGPVGDAKVLPKWASWGGRFHRLVKDGDPSAIACGPRDPKRPPKAAALDVPLNAAHDLCAALDALAAKDAAGDMVGPGETEPYLITDPAPVVVPPGMCVCGAGGCNTPDAVKVRALMKARDAVVKATRLAAFDAFLAAKAVTV